ncbi:hypothetical protein VULLAG_LOCUS3545 [Vulpes lagopus]
MLASIRSRERPRTVTPWAQSHSVLNRTVLFCPFSCGEELEAEKKAEALCCQGPMCLCMEPTLCMEALDP